MEHLAIDAFVFTTPYYGKITCEMALEMIRDIPNLVGIKSAYTGMIRKRKLTPAVPNDFIMVYSDPDTFDVVYQWGINAQLGGMLFCTPTNTRPLYEAMGKGDFTKAAVHMNNILNLRNMFIANSLWVCCTVAVNLLSYDGEYDPDYVFFGRAGVPALVEAGMRRIGEI